MSRVKQQIKTTPITSVDYASILARQKEIIQKNRQLIAAAGAKDLDDYLAMKRKQFLGKGNSR